MEKTFNLGDRVRSKFYGVVGTVIDVDADGYIINPDHVEEMWIAEEDAEAYDRKTDFLTRLSELMREFDAEIDTYITLNKYGGEVSNLSFKVGDDVVDYECNSFQFKISPDNIMDYDKE